VGGGITGAGILRDAVLRGYKVALIEKADFASGTSSKSSKLVHGGFRYLAQFKFGLVHEALVERKILIDLAPHLVHPLECLLPIYTNSRQKPWIINIGMYLYDLLAFSKNIGNHRMLSPRKIQEFQPELRQEDLLKGAEYYDAKADDFRLVLSTLQSAVEFGGIAINYVEARLLDRLRSGGFEVVAHDHIADKDIIIRTRTIANATGPWSDIVRENLIAEHKKRVRTTKGIHLIVRWEDLPIKKAYMLFSPIDDRPIFAIPWKKFVLLGTTDTDYDGDPDRIPTERSDVDYLLESFNYYFPRCPLDDSKIISSFAGLRPLIYEAGKDASEVTREHEIFEGPENFFTIIGGKLTTYRVMAREIVDRIGKQLQKDYKINPRNPYCHTHKLPLYGGDIRDFRKFREETVATLSKSHGLATDIIEHFVETYGRETPTVLKYAESRPDGLQRIVPPLPHVWGELDYALDREMVVGLDDFLIRRTHIFSLDPQHGRGVYEEIARRMQKVLNWDDVELKRQVERYLFKTQLINKFRISDK